MSNQNKCLFQRLTIAWIILTPGTLFAQQDDPLQAVDGPKPEVIDKRIMGVLPNYRTADGTIAFVPITARQKLTIAAKDSFDKPVYVLAGLFAGISQLENSNPGLGQGMAGYGRRYIRNLGTTIIGNLLTEGALPALLHDDPRYFRVGSNYGSGGRRLSYALTRVMVNRSDKGNWRFNTSEWLGNALAIGIQNTYYTEDRTWGGNALNLGLQVGIDAFSNVMKEFWPDVKRKLQARHEAKTEPHL